MMNLWIAVVQERRVPGASDAVACTARHSEDLDESLARRCGAAGVLRRMMLETLRPT